MYVPPHFAVPDQNALFDLIEKYPFGILITQSKGSLDANHIPFELDRSKGDKGVLNCHVARKKSLPTPMVSSLSGTTSAMCAAT